MRHLFKLIWLLVAGLLVSCQTTNSNQGRNNAATDIETPITTQVATQSHLIHRYENAFLVYEIGNRAFALIQFDEAPELPNSVTLVAPTETTIQLRDAAGKNYFYSTTPEGAGHYAVQGTATFQGAAANEVFLTFTDGKPSINPDADPLSSPCLCRGMADDFSCESGGKGSGSAGASKTTMDKKSFCDVRCGGEYHACVNL